MLRFFCALVSTCTKHPHAPLHCTCLAIKNKRNRSFQFIPRIRILLCPTNNLLTMRSKKKNTQNLTVRKFVERHNGIHRLGYVNGFNTNLKSWAHLEKHLKGMYPFLFLSQKHTSKLAKSTLTTHPSGIVPSQGRQTLPSVSVGLNCYPSNRPT